MDSSAQTDPLRQIAADIVDTKGGIDEDLRTKMINELVVTMERFINTELLAHLSDEQAQEFSQFLDTNPTEEATLQFFKERGINVEVAVTVALQQFKDAYVGN